MTAESADSELANSSGRQSSADNRGIGQRSSIKYNISENSKIRTISRLSGIYFAFQLSYILAIKLWINLFTFKFDIMKTYLEKLWDVKEYGENYDDTHIDFKSARTEIVAAKLGH